MSHRMGVRTALALALLPGSCAKGDGRAARPVVHEATKTPEADGGRGAPAPAPHDDEAAKHEELPTKVRLPSSVVRSAGIKTSPATLDSLPATVDLTGEIAVDTAQRNGKRHSCFPVSVARLTRPFLVKKITCRWPRIVATVGVQ